MNKKVLNKKSLSFGSALDLINTAVAKAEEIGLNISQKRSSIKYNQLNYTFSTRKYNDILKKT